MKKISKLLCCILGLGFLLTGCATVGNIKNSSSELIYNGNSAVMVDGYLYYGNAFSDYTTFSSDGDYKSGAKLSYLARLNTNDELNATSKDYSPKSVEKVSEEVAGQKNSFMFVLGDYIYYATPNRQRIKGDDGSSDFKFEYTSFFRSKLNGDKKDKFYTTDGEITDLEVVKYDDKYYIVVLAGEKLTKIQLGNKLSITEIASDVTSVAIPKTRQNGVSTSTFDWNGYVYYTTDKTDEDNSDISGSIVKRLSISGGDAETIEGSWKNARTIEFIGREEDMLFYTMTGDKTEVFASDVSSDSATSKNFVSNQKKFYSASTISDITLISTENKDYGYIFTTSAGTLMHVTKDGKFGVVTLTNGDDTLSSYKLLFVNGRTIYLSTTTGIFSADLSALFNGTATTATYTTIVTMTAIYDETLYAYDGKYIYYYAQLETIESDSDDEDEDDTETDENYYLYRTEAIAKSETATQYQLLGLTSISSRRSN